MTVGDAAIIDTMTTVTATTIDVMELVASQSTVLRGDPSTLRVDIWDDFMFDSGIQIRYTELYQGIPKEMVILLGEEVVVT